MQTQEIKTPQQNDEAMLYKLNSDIMLESRKHNNSEEIVNQMLQKIKNENPGLLQRIRNNKTDCSTNSYSVDSIQRYSSNEVKTNSNEVGIGEANKISSGATSSAIDPSPYAIGFHKANQTAVKSSTQLLHIHNANKDSSSERNQLSDREEHVNRCYQEDFSINVSHEENNTSYDKRQTEASYRIDKNNTSKTNDTIEIIDISDNENNIETFCNVSDSDTCSDTADALTQVIEECSLGEHRTCNKNQSSSSRSLDEEFLSEVMNEINKDIQKETTMNILDLILTPPMGFRND